MGDGNALGIIIQAVLEVVTRHLEHRGVPPSPEEVEAELAKQVGEGRTDIAAWFASKGA
jgi:hypothetical protein